MKSWIFTSTTTILSFIIVLSNLGLGSLAVASTAKCNPTTRGVVDITIPPTNCEIVPLGMDTCEDLAAPLGNLNITAECQVNLKGVDSALKICTFVNVVPRGTPNAVAPNVSGICTPVDCNHPCYIPCAYFIARNREFKKFPGHEFSMSHQKAYACGIGCSLVCGCAAVAEQFSIQI